MKHLQILFLCCVIMKMQAQVSGYILSENGDTLPYATVYIEGTSKGTVANDEGEYSLALDQGDYNLVYQYIGYEKKVIPTTITERGKRQDVRLKEDSYLIDDVIIDASAEDPAYAIIRNAIKARESNRNKIKSYIADIYVKGVIKMVDAPESFLGQEVGDLDGILDSTRQGILYLSESQSRIWYEQPDKVKEEMYSSIVSGDESGINANQFNNSRFDFYQEYQQFNRSLISPIADNALSYYNYRLIGTTYDSDGSLVNRIEVIPKSRFQPVFFGTIYIYENIWSIHSLDLSFTGQSAKQKIFDTLRVQQIFVPLGDEGIYPLYTQTMSFGASLLGFKVVGAFNYILSDYEINIEHEQGTFTDELFTMSPDAIVTDTAFWDEVRPISLTEEERSDYAKKDSLKRLWESKPYLDSLDGENNKPKWFDLLFGYSYRNSYEKRFIDYKSPLSSLQFNAVEGYVLKTNIEARLYDSTENKQLRLKPELQYGFSDKQFKATMDIRYRYDRLHRGFLLLSGGRKYRQLDNRSPVMSNINTLYSLLGKKNLLHLYDDRYIRAGLFREIWNGIYAQANISYHRRSSLKLNTDHSWFNEDDQYRLNSVIGEGEQMLNIPIPDHDALSYQLRVVWRPGQKYMTFPNFRSRISSGAPTFTLLYAHGRLDNRYDRLKMIIRDRRVDANLWGFSSYSLEGGVFLNKEQVFFMDAFHFKGNETFINYASHNLEQFKLMPQYVYSTTASYGAAFVEHHFDGFIFDRIPIARDLGAQLIVGTNAMLNKNIQYYECSVGIENIGIGPFTLFRIDYAWARDSEGYTDHGIMIGLSQIFQSN